MGRVELMLTDYIECGLESFKGVKTSTTQGIKSMEHEE